VIAREQHADGQPHLHLSCRLRSRYRSRDPHDLDCIGNKHGNYQVLKNQAGNFKYLTKEDPEVLCHGININEVLRKHQGRTDWIASRLARDGDVTALLQEEPGFMLLHHAKVLSYCKLLQMQNKRRKTADDKSSLAFTTDLLPHIPETVQVVQWLELNIRKARAFKQKQLWIWGGPDLGKTSLGLSLQEHVSIYWAPLEGTYDDLYEDGIYDLIIFDEYHGQRKLTWLNSFVQGAPMTIKRRYSDCIKQENPPVIVLSNYPPDQCYRNISATTLQTVLTRFIVINITSFMKINVTTS
jgi:hypothetical protein